MKFILSGLRLGDMGKRTFGFGYVLQTGLLIFSSLHTTRFPSAGSNRKSVLKLDSRPIQADFRSSLSQKKCEKESLSINGLSTNL